MTMNDKQPTGWVVVDFADDVAPFLDSRDWHAKTWPPKPFASREDAEDGRLDSRYCDSSEVHPWPLPASVIDRLKERHPTVDWSQVPVADAPVEKPGRWVVQELPDEPDLPFRDQDGWQQSADVCLMPWSTKADAEAFMRSKGWISDCFVPVNLDDLPSPAVAEPSEVERLRAEVESLRGSLNSLRNAINDFDGADRGREIKLPVGRAIGIFADLRAEVERLTRERDEHQSDADALRKDLAAYADQLCAIWALLPDDIATQGGPAASAVRGFIDRLTRERDEARASFASICRHSDEQRLELDRLRKSPLLSRIDEFAKAALTGMLADPERAGAIEDFAADAVEYAQATIRAIDGAGGA